MNEDVEHDRKLKRYIRRIWLKKILSRQYLLTIQIKG